MANKIISYFKESKEELKKVTWPTRQETVRQTIIVLGVCLAVGAFLGLVDFLLNLGVQQIISMT